MTHAYAATLTREWTNLASRESDATILPMPDDLAWLELSEGVTE